MGMNRIQIAQALCELSGVRDLVEDYEGGDYRDKSGIATPASYWINAGIRMLDQRWGLSGTRKRTSVSLAQGQVYFEVPSVEFIERIETFDSDGVRRVLRQIPHDELRNMYDDPLEDADQDLPIYWCRAYGQRFGASLTNGDFSLGLTGWTTQAGSPSVAGGVLTLGSTGVDKSDLSVDWKVGLPDVSIVSGNAHMKAITGDVSTMFKDTNVSSSPFSLNISTLPANSTVTVYTLLNLNIVDTNAYTTSGTKTINPSGNYDRITVQFSTSEVTEQTAIINDISLFSQVVDVLYQRLNSRSDGSDDLSIVIDTITAGATLTVRVGTWNSAYANITTVTSATYNTNGTKTLTPTGAWDVISIAISADDAATAGISSISLESEADTTPTFTSPWFIAMPPADQAYTLTVFGDFSQELETDSSVNWWTINKPDWVIEAARAKLELDRHRNVSGMTAFLGHIEAELDRMVAQDRFSYMSGMTPKEACIDG